MTMSGIAFYDPEAVHRLLDYPGCIAAMREAMAALSASGADQPLRQIVQLGPSKLFGLMPGTLPTRLEFGAKLVSVFGEPGHPDHLVHRGIVTLFDGDSGEIRCIGDAGAITEIRTACASAVATDLLARADARVLAVFGTGTQAQAHIRALVHVRPIEKIVVWGRSMERAQALATRMERETRIAAAATTDAPLAARHADIICTVTAAPRPILLGDWVQPGTHVNLVGSSYLGPVETDNALVQKSRYVADYRPSALSAAAEFAAAKAAGLIDDDHLVAEIGEVLLWPEMGRSGDDEVTVYKSLGHVVQDLGALAYVHGRAARERIGS
jgi:ornithine cyclodeaminase